MDKSLKVGEDEKRQTKRRERNFGRDKREKRE